MELKFEVHELSCFDLASKQLNLLAYIGRTSDNQRINRIEQEFERIEEIKISGKYLQWRSGFNWSWSCLCLILLHLLAEEGLSAYKAVNSWRFEFQNSGNSTSNSNEFLKFIFCKVRVWDGGSKLARMCVHCWACEALFIAETIDICTLEITFQNWSLMMHGCMGAYRPLKLLH